MTATLLDAYELLHSGAIALAAAERAGIAVDVDYCRERIAWIDEQGSRSVRRLSGSALGRAWTSRFGDGVVDPREWWRSYSRGGQLQAVLYADMKVKPFKQTDKGEDSVDEESLLQTGVDGIAHLLRLRSLKKMRDVLSQFLQYQVSGRIHPSYNLHTVVTYRSSCSNPNLQNVPTRDKEQMRVCRRAIVPSPGNVLLEVDFSGIEVSVACSYHKDPTMIAYLRDPSSDMHGDVAKELFFLDGKVADLKKRDGFSSVLRQAAKNAFVFPQFYGDYFESCSPNIACGWLKLPRVGDWTDDDGASFDGEPIARRLRQHDVGGLPSFTEHVRSVEDGFWNRRFPVYARWKRDFYARYQRRGTISMKTGFVCSGAMVRNAAVNYPVQGAAFHLLLKTFTLVERRIRGWRSRVVGEVHDSVLVDAAPDEVGKIVEMIRIIASEELPRLWDWINVPLRVEAKVSEVDGNWSEMRVIE